MIALFTRDDINYTGISVVIKSRFARDLFCDMLFNKFSFNNLIKTRIRYQFKPISDMLLEC